MLKGINLFVGSIFFCVLILSCTYKNERESGEHKVKSELIIKDVSHSNESISKFNLKEKSDKFNFKYDLSQPDQTSILSLDLIEISALSFDRVLNVLYAVNDEKGILFSLDPASGKIKERRRFAKKGDYEGVEVGMNGEIYALKSNGNIIAIQKSDGESTIYKTELHSSNDVEGLGYNSNKNLLLLACKGYPSISKTAVKTKSEKSVYAWSTESKKLIKEPILRILDKNLLDYYQSLDLKLSKSQKKKYRKRLRNFSPSGIAYNESERMYYLISSVGKTLVIVDAASSIHHVEFLDDTYFAQPEGICFGEDNALYISNEGRGLIAKIMRFDVQM